MRFSADTVWKEAEARISLSLLCFSSWSQCVYSLSPEEKKSKREKGDFQHFFLLGTAIIEVTDICVLNIRQPLFPCSLKSKLTANEFQVPLE